MKILMVSMNSIHFRRWTAQLEDAGHEVFWFDALGAGGAIKELPWVHQNSDWRLRVKKGRYLIKKVGLLKRLNERSIVKAFERYLLKIKPDVVHSFALQISAIPILKVMNNFPELKWIASSWGSDIYYYKELGINNFDIKNCLYRVDYLFTDCLRDYKIAKEIGFDGVHLGVFPGNGGIEFPNDFEELRKPKDRNLIFVKSYDDGIGKGDVLIESILGLPKHMFDSYQIVFLGVSDLGARMLKMADPSLDIVFYKKSNPVSNSIVLQLLSESYVYIGNSLSDGIPNLLLEAMGHGAFPIQSNPGRVSEEVIQKEINGLLISDPLDKMEIQGHIVSTLKNRNMVNQAFELNIKKIRNRCSRDIMKKKIQKAYENLD